MTEQERQDRIKAFGYPPHTLCGECPAWDNYGEGDSNMDSYVIHYCQNNCEYYKEMCGYKQTAVELKSDK